MRVITILILCLLLNISLLSAQNQNPDLLLEKELSAEEKHVIDSAKVLISTSIIMLEELKQIEETIEELEQKIQSTARRPQQDELIRQRNQLLTDAGQKRVTSLNLSKKAYSLMFYLYYNKLTTYSGHANYNIAFDKMQSIKSEFISTQVVQQELLKKPFEIISENNVYDIAAAYENTVISIKSIFCIIFDCHNLTSYNNSSANNNSDNRVIFRVQIQALSKPMHSDLLNTVSSGNYGIHIDYEDNLYKYLVGEFHTYQEAYNYKLTLGEETFIVGYQNNVRIRNITRAIELSNNQ